MKQKYGGYTIFIIPLISNWIARTCSNPIQLYRRVAELEHKPDNFVTLLQNNQPQSNEVTPPRSISRNNTLDELANLATSQAALPINPPESLPCAQFITNHHLLKPQDAPPTAPQETSDHPCISHSSPDDEANLGIFKTQMSWYFPFIVIPAETTAQTLRKERPFLFRTIILAVKHHQKWHRKEYWKEVVDYISLHIILRGEKSLDLLQGLLIYTAW